MLKAYLDKYINTNVDIINFLRRNCREMHMLFDMHTSQQIDLLTPDIPDIAPANRFSFFSIIDAIHKDIMEIYTALFYPYGCGYVNNLVSKLLRNNNVDNLFCYDKAASNHCVIINLEGFYFILDFIGDQFMCDEKSDHQDIVKHPVTPITSLDLEGIHFEFDDNGDPIPNKKPSKKDIADSKKIEYIDISISPLLIPLFYVLQHKHFSESYISNSSKFSKINYQLDERKELLEKYSNIKIKNNDFNADIITLLGFL